MDVRVYAVVDVLISYGCVLIAPQLIYGRTIVEDKIGTLQTAIVLLWCCKVAWYHVSQPRSEFDVLVSVS